jgi:hypothetical protein
MLLVCTVSSVLYSEIALSRKPFGIGHMYIYNFSVLMTDTMTSSECGPLLLGHSVYNTEIGHRDRKVLDVILPILLRHRKDLTLYNFICVHVTGQLCAEP